VANYYGAIRVAAGLGDDIETSAANPRIPRLRRHLTPEQQRKLALRLRHEGWSYRRIAAQLGVPYPTVCSWLDGPAAMTLTSTAIDKRGPPVAVSTLVVPKRSVGQVSPPPSEKAAVMPTLAELIDQNRRLSEQVEQLLQEQAVLKQAIVAVEDRLRASMEQRRQSLLERLEDAGKQP
jgi:hypothetical protein